MDERLGELRRAWEADRLWSGFYRWAVAAARAGELDGLRFFKAVERVASRTRRGLKLVEVAGALPPSLRRNALHALETRLSGLIERDLERGRKAVRALARAGVEVGKLQGPAGRGRGVGAWSDLVQTEARARARQRRNDRANRLGQGARLAREEARRLARHADIAEDGTEWPDDMSEHVGTWGPTPSAADVARLPGVPDETVEEVVRAIERADVRQVITIGRGGDVRIESGTGTGDPTVVIDGGRLTSRQTLALQAAVQRREMAGAPRGSAAELRMNLARGHCVRAGCPNQAMRGPMRPLCNRHELERLERQGIDPGASGGPDEGQGEVEDQDEEGAWLTRT